jgi:hypothetical protein
MDRLYGVGSSGGGHTSTSGVGAKNSILHPVNFISGHIDDPIFIGRNNTEILAHAGSNVVFDCLVGRPNLEDQGPVRTFIPNPDRKVDIKDNHLGIKLIPMIST